MIYKNIVGLAFILTFLVGNIDLNRSHTFLLDEIIRDFNFRHKYDEIILDIDSTHDFNFDAINDVSVQYTYQAGTGLRNRQDIYLVSKIHTFKVDSLLSTLTNLSFYSNRKLCTSFYLGTGGGDACSFIWRGKWELNQRFKFEPFVSSTNPSWRITINKDGKDSVFNTAGLEMVPDTSIIPNLYQDLK